DARRLTPEISRFASPNSCSVTLPTHHPTNGHNESHPRPDRKAAMSVMQKFSLEGKTALVTGGNRGLGKAIALALAEAGAAVAVTARDGQDAAAAASALREAGHRALGVALEVSDLDSVERAVETIEAELGPIDVLVNNAGISI